MQLRFARVEPLHLGLALAVEARLLDEADAELGERGDEHVHLVQRVLDVDLGVELELEADPIRAVRGAPVEAGRLRKRRTSTRALYGFGIGSPCLAGYG